MKTLIIFAALLAAGVAQAEDRPWTFEFEFAQGIPGFTDRLLLPDCGAVVPTAYAEWYAVDPRPGFTIACGNEQPMYTHFLGRRCWRPLPHFTVDCGWRHFSSPRDSHEITFDAISVRGRFAFNFKRR